MRPTRREPPGPVSPELEEAIRRGLGARAATLHATPDPADLARRLEQSARKLTRHGQLAAAAAVVVLAGALGGILGVVLVPAHPQHALFSSSAGRAPGGLPTGPSGGGGRASKDSPSAGAGLGALGAKTAPVSISRLAAGGVRLAAYASWLGPVSVASAGSSSRCTAYELVATTATADAKVSGGAGVVGIEPLAPFGLEVVDSGSMRTGASSLSWWATVAVGSAVARVDGQLAGGPIDSMRPDRGIAVIGGTAPILSSSGYLSVVAENAEGQALGSVGIMTGWGPKVAGGDPAASAVLPPGARCSPLGTTTKSSGPRAAPTEASLVAASAVLSAFHQAYASATPAGMTENLAAVVGGGLFESFATAAGTHSPRRVLAGSSQPATPRALASSVQVAGVTLLSSSTAEVVFRVRSGPWQTGLARLASGGRWQVSRQTFCAGVLNGVPASASVPTGIVGECAKLAGRV